MSDCLVESVRSSVLALGEGDTLPKPSVTLLGADGGPVEPSDIASVVMHFEDVKPESLVEPLYTPNSFTVAGVQVGDTATWEFTLDGGTQTNAVISWRTKVVITETGGTYTRPTAPVHVVDYDALWATPGDVESLASGYSNSEYVAAILAAEGAVRAWVTTPVLSPVSERVAYAVALLAARALSSPPSGVMLTSETMGDYTARFRTTGPGGLHISDDIKDLLSPWKPGITSIDTGPTGATADPWWTEMALPTT